MGGSGGRGSTGGVEAWISVPVLSLRPFSRSVRLRRLLLGGAALALALGAGVGCSDRPVGRRPAGNSATRQAPDRQVQGEAADQEPRLRAVSLRQLQRGLAICLPARSCSEVVLAFGGLTRVLGYAVDPPHQDVVVYGLAGRASPPIRTEDLVIALRSSWRQYAVRRGDVYVYSDPGCDIRPLPETMRRLQQLEPAIHAGATVAATDAAVYRWQEACESPQRVSVLGVPPDVAFARVMVTADYDMKRLADGTDDTGLPGMSSVADLSMAGMRAALRRHQRPAMGAQMNRFWLTAGEVSYEEADGVTWIPDCPVQVRTHQTGADVGGNLRDVAGNDPAAEDFAFRFSRLYSQVAELRPVYRQLANLFQLFALTQAMRFRQADSRAGLDLGYLLHVFPVAESRVARELPGRFAVKRFHSEQDVAGGREITQFWLPSCGGVEMGVEASAGQFRENPSLASLGKRVLDQRPAQPRVSWEVARDGKLAALEHNQRLRRFNRPGSPLVVTVVDLGSEYRAYAGREYGEIYSGGLDAREVMSRAAAYSRDHQGTGTVYLELEHFQPPKAESFATTCQLEAREHGEGIKVRTLPDIVGTVAEQLLFTPGIRLLETRKAEMVSEGPRRGLYRGLASFMVRVRGALLKATITVIGRSALAVDGFLERIGAQFSLLDSLPLSVVDVLDLAWRELQRAGFSPRDIELTFESERQKVHFVDAGWRRETAPS